MQAPRFWVVLVSIMLFRSVKGNVGKHLDLLVFNNKKKDVERQWNMGGIAIIKIMSYILEWIQAIDVCRQFNFARCNLKIWTVTHGRYSFCCFYHVVIHVSCDRWPLEPSCNGLVIVCGRFYQENPLFSIHFAKFLGKFKESLSWKAVVQSLYPVVGSHSVCLPSTSIFYMVSYHLTL